MNGLLKFITCGSVDDGKSTLIGHILYDSKLLYADQEKALILESKVGSRAGKIDYSLLLDGLMAEREQGITIDVAYRYFTTDKRSFIVADTPGHEEYTRNMAVGASFADLSIILMDATKGVLVQTRRHARICKLMGIQHFIFAVNKMDLAGYSEQRFREIQQEIDELVKELDLADVTVIPVSATEGDNVTVRSENMPWYNGPVLLEKLETVEITQTENNSDFCLPIQRVCRPNHEFRGFQGQIEYGSVSVGDTVYSLPSNETAQVKSILVGDRQVETAEAGQPVTVQLNREVDVSRGSVLSGTDRLKAIQRTTATLLWMDDEPLTIGKEYLMKVGTKRIPAVVENIEYKIDVNTGEHLPADSIEKNGIVRCELVFAEKIIVDTFAHNKALGALILIDRVSHMTAACGVIESLNDGRKKPTFADGGKQLTAALFDELVYLLGRDTVVRREAEDKTYGVGDSIPTVGASFRYPNDFDVVSEEQGTAVRIRSGKVERVLALDSYASDGVPAVDEHGFARTAEGLVFGTYRTAAIEA